MSFEQSNDSGKSISLDEKEINEGRENLREFADEITGFLCSITGDSADIMKKQVDSSPFPPLAD